MESNQWAYNSGPRVAKDGKWFIAYIASMVVAGVVGVIAWSNTNPLFHRAISDARFMNNPRSCMAGSSGRRLLDDDDFVVTKDFDLLEAFWRVAARAIIGSLVPALVAGFALIQLIRKHPQTMVVVGLALPIVLLCGLAVTMVVSDMPELCVIYLAPALILCVVVARFRSQVKLIGRLLKVAADSVAANPALVPFALGTNFSVLPPIIALAAVIYFLQGNGTVAPNPAVASSSFAIGGTCRDEASTLVPCCAWSPAPWVLPVQMAVAVVLVWTDALAGQLRTYVMGGVITRWYFHEETRGTIWLCLKHALGPARGTLCFSAAVVTVCNIIRGLVNRIRNHRGNPVYLLISCALAWLLNFIEELIRFVSTLATIQAAATGEAFLDAARSVGAMLTRHSLSAASVWWMPNMVLGSMVLSIAFAAGIAAYYIVASMWAGSHRHNATTDAIALAIMVGYSFLLLTGLLVGFVRSATDVVYVCFARDLDNRAVTRPDVHEVLKDIPTATGAVVVQPDNNMMYGAMEAGEMEEREVADSDSPTAPLAGRAPAPVRDLTAAIESQPPPQPPRKG